MLFGQQPNTVQYDLGNRSFLAILRGVNDTPDEKAKNLADRLNGKSVDIRVETVGSDDGENLRDVLVQSTFEFAAPQQLDSVKLEAATNIDIINDLEKFLAQPAGVAGLTNMELATVDLSTIEKEKREAVKSAREEVLSKIEREYKLPIKDALLDKLVRSTRSKFSSSTAEQDGLGIEGIVLRDPISKRQVKLVDKTLFTTLNKFNQAARARVQGALNTTDPSASLEARGGLLGDLRLKIAETLGNREIAKPSNLKKVLKGMRGKDSLETVNNLAKSLNITDFQAVRLKILALISTTAKQLSADLKEFKDNRDKYQLKLSNGKEIKLSNETIKKTLVFFAEARKNLQELFNKVKETAELPHLLAVLYGGVINSAQSVTESMLVERKAPKKPKKKVVRKAPLGEVDLTEFRNRDGFRLINGYLATVFLAMFIYHSEDAVSLRLLRDRKNYRLTRWSHDMSVLNHWGYMFWKSSRPDVKEVLLNRSEKEIQHITKKIPSPWWKFFHMDFSFDKKVKVDWEDHRKLIQRVIDLSGLRSERLNTLLQTMVDWPSLGYDDKVKAANRLYLYALQFVPRSVLFKRFRILQTQLVLNPPESIMSESLLRQIVRIAEEGDGGGGGGDAGGGAPAMGDGSSSGIGNATTAGAISPLPARIFTNKRQIIKRTRRDLTRLGFKFKDPRKSSK